LVTHELKILPGKFDQLEQVEDLVEGQSLNLLWAGRTHLPGQQVAQGDLLAICNAAAIVVEGCAEIP
jgi:hypothetical protein